MTLPLGMAGRVPGAHSNSKGSQEGFGVNFFKSGEGEKKGHSNEYKVVKPDCVIFIFTPNAVIK